MRSSSRPWAPNGDANTVSKTSCLLKASSSGIAQVTHLAACNTIRTLSFFGMEEMHRARDVWRGMEHLYLLWLDHSQCLPCSATQSASQLYSSSEASFGSLNNYLIGSWWSTQPSAASLLLKVGGWDRVVSALHNWFLWQLASSLQLYRSAPRALESKR